MIKRFSFLMIVAGLYGCGGESPAPKCSSASVKPLVNPGFGLVDLAYTDMSAILTTYSCFDCHGTGANGREVLETEDGFKTNIDSVISKIADNHQSKDVSEENQNKVKAYKVGLVLDASCNSCHATGGSAAGKAILDTEAGVTAAKDKVETNIANGHQSSTVAAADQTAVKAYLLTLTGGGDTGGGDTGGGDTGGGDTGEPAAEETKDTTDDKANAGSTTEAGKVPEACKAG